jgi:hypothetical protein
MANLEISNLNSAGSDLFAGTDSFLTELQASTTTQIFGGYNYRCGGRRGKKTSIKIAKKTSWKTPTPPTAPTPPTKVTCRPVPCFVPVRNCR